MKSAAAIISENPETPVIINHMGCLYLADCKNDESQVNNAIKLWRDGMILLSQLPNVSVKISMLSFTDPNWDKSPLIKSLVHETILRFGSSRSMFVSNFPTDLGGTDTPKKIFDAYRSFIADFPKEVQEDLFSRTAQRVYKL